MCQKQGLFLQSADISETKIDLSVIDSVIDVEMQEKY